MMRLDNQLPGAWINKNSIIRSMLVIKDFLLWLLTGWWPWCWPITSQVWKFLSTNFDFNSLAPERFQRNFWKVIFQLIFFIDVWSISCKIVLKWMPMGLTDGKSTSVQVMAWCRQAPSHYLSKCWPRSLAPYGVIRPQWVNMEFSYIQAAVSIQQCHLARIGNSIMEIRSHNHKIVLSKQRKFLHQYDAVLNTLRPRQNGYHFTDNIFQCIFWKWK